MKKILGFMLVAMLVFSGCGKTATPGAALVDGTYRAEMSEAFAEAEGHGWRGYLVAEVKSGAVATVEFDYTNADGELKSAQSAEAYPMTPHPSDWVPQLTDSAKNKTSAEDIDAITGATTSSNEMKELFAAVLEAAKTGKTETITVN